MVKSFSVGAPEPEKLQKNKVGPIIWDTLTLITYFENVEEAHAHSFHSYVTLDVSYVKWRQFN